MLSACDGEDLQDFVDQVTESSAPCQAETQLQAEALARINEARAQARQCGNQSFPAAPPLAWHGLIYQAALTHSEDMARHNFFSHTGSDGSDPGIRLNTAGYAWRSHGENIGAGYASVESAVRGWLNSPGHCANIMNAALSEMGLACATSTLSQYGSYWTLLLAAPR